MGSGISKLQCKIMLLRRERVLSLTIMLGETLPLFFRCSSVETDLGMDYRKNLLVNCANNIGPHLKRESSRLEKYLANIGLYVGSRVERGISHQLKTLRENHHCSGPRRITRVISRHLSSKSSSRSEG